MVTAVRRLLVEVARESALPAGRSPEHRFCVQLFSVRMLARLAGQEELQVLLIEEGITAALISAARQWLRQAPVDQPRLTQPEQPESLSEAAQDRSQDAGWSRSGSWVEPPPEAEAVPIKRGDSLQKLSLKYDRTVAAIKTANNIVGNEIEAWRDDLQLPGELEGKSFKRPTDDYGMFCFMLQVCGVQRALPSRAEVEAYLALSDGDARAAVDAWADDMDCALQSLLRNCLCRIEWT